MPRRRAPLILMAGTLAAVAVTATAPLPNTPDTSDRAEGRAGSAVINTLPFPFPMVTAPLPAPSVPPTSPAPDSPPAEVAPVTLVRRVVTPDTVTAAPPVTPAPAPEAEPAPQPVPVPAAEPVTVPTETHDCPEDTPIWTGVACVPDHHAPCPPWQTQDETGACVVPDCPTGTVPAEDGTCVPSDYWECPADMAHAEDGTCVPSGYWDNPPTTPPVAVVVSTAFPQYDPHN